MGQQFSWEEAEGEENRAVDVAELQEWYKKFLTECPSGSLFMHEFKRFFKVAGNEEATQYVEGMFVPRLRQERGKVPRRAGRMARVSSWSERRILVGARLPSPPALPPSSL